MSLQSPKVIWSLEPVEKTCCRMAAPGDKLEGTDPDVASGDVSSLHTGGSCGRFFSSCPFWLLYSGSTDRGFSGSVESAESFGHPIAWAKRFKNSLLDQLPEMRLDVLR